jgi:nickel-dependent lactate racemase
VTRETFGRGEHVMRNGDAVERLGVPPERLLDVIAPRPSPPAGDATAAVELAFDHPVGSEPLEVLAVGARRPVIVCDDMTRPTPTDLLLPVVLDRLNRAGVEDSQVTVLIATGTHRPMTEDELTAKLGADVVARVTVTNHVYEDRQQLVNLGTTPSGIPVTVNRLVAESDLVIGVGNIVPHRYCGWAGGAKIIQPGVCGAETTAATHLMITRFPDVGLGSLDNTVRREIDGVADAAGLRFIVNTVLNAEQEVVGVVCGDHRAAFARGVEQAREVYGAPFRGRADIVVASAHPSDINLWQAGKSWYSAELVVRRGGLVIMASPCSEGIGEHGSFAELMGYDRPTLEHLLATDQVQDRISAAAALACALVREHCEVWLASTGITDADASRMGMRKFATAADALNVAMAERPDGLVSLLHNATEVLPLAVGEAA